jgi:hypothetical protein
LPRQRAKEKAVTAKTAPRDIRGVTQGQRQLHTAANETVRSVTTQAQKQTRAQKIRFAAQKVAAGTGKTAVAVRSAIRHFLADLHSLTAVLAAGSGAAMGIVIVISLVALVSGSAYGIFFAADAPNATSVTVREAVETLTEEYRDRLEEISDTVQYDRQDITANDDVYYIRWQDVLAVFSSYVSGNEQGSPVAALTEEQVDKLREIMWAMNAVDYAIHTETAVIETTDKNGKPTTATITETVLVIRLTHKTPGEMAADYHFTTRQNNYLQLLQDPQYEELWAELLGGFAKGGGEVMSPDSTRTPTGTLQWPLPVAGTITSQFGHRVDPITGEVSSHTGTDIACTEGTPILAAADGTVTVANGLDSWGGSYGYYIQIDPGQRVHNAAVRTAERNHHRHNLLVQALALRNVRFLSVRQFGHIGSAAADAVRQPTLFQFLQRALGRDTADIVLLCKVHLGRQALTFFQRAAVNTLPQIVCNFLI